MTGDYILLTIHLCLYCCDGNLSNERHESHRKKCLTVRQTEKEILFIGTYRQELVFNIHDSNRDLSTRSVSSLCQCPPFIQLVKGSPM